MMVSLAVETSSREVSVAVGTRDVLLYDSASDSEFTNSSDLAQIVLRALHCARISVNDLKLIIVDIGPGGLNAVRFGVAFANALSHSLSIPILPISSIEILAREASDRVALPIVCVRGAHRSNIHAGFWTDNAISRTFSGSVELLAQELKSLSGRRGIAGRFRRELLDLLPEGFAVDTGVEVPSARTLLRFLDDDRVLERIQSTPVGAITI